MILVFLFKNIDRFNKEKKYDKINIYTSKEVNMKVKKKYNIQDQKYYNCIKDLIETDVVQEMDKYIQHGTTTCLKHCIDVSYKSYLIAKKLKLDYISVARAALLHDLFLYDWHYLPKIKITKLFKMHGYTHSTIALENANKHFKLTDKEKDIILKHMWPLTLTKVPKYKESMVVTLVDKYISTKETISPYLKRKKI